VSYRERALGPGVVLWQATGPTTVLPDGCLDVIWNGTGLVVAGPDTAARHHPGTAPHTGVRFSGGSGPGRVGVPADAVRDRTVAVEDLWSPGAVRELTDRVAADPARALAAWVRAGHPDVDAVFGARVVGGLERGASVAALADAFGVTPRTLHRRCLPVFGYGPQHLGRILRLQRALARAGDGVPWATVAADAGYVDQPHLAREVRALTGTTPTGLLALRG